MQKGNTCKAGLYFHLLPTQGYNWENFTAAGGRDVLPRDRPQPIPPVPALEGDTVSWGEGTIQGGGGETSRSGSRGSTG